MRGLTLLAQKMLGAACILIESTNSDKERGGAGEEVSMFSSALCQGGGTTPVV